MGTRAIIAVGPSPDKATHSTYHHWDGYPTGLGLFLVRLCGEKGAPFDGAADLLFRFLTIHSWSTIQTEWWFTETGREFASALKQTGGYGIPPRGGKPDGNAAMVPPCCHCHTLRDKLPEPLGPDSASFCNPMDNYGQEYLYMLDMSGETPTLNIYACRGETHDKVSCKLTMMFSMASHHNISLVKAAMAEPVKDRP